MKRTIAFVSMIIVAMVMMSCGKDINVEPEKVSPELKSTGIDFFKSRKPWPTTTLDVAGYTYTEQEGRMIALLKNVGITQDVFIAIVSLKLSLFENYIFLTSEVYSYIIEMESWLAPKGKLDIYNLRSQAPADTQMEQALENLKRALRGKNEVER